MGFGALFEAATGATSCLGVVVPEAGCEFILLSDRIASFVENIRVRRFVIEGFSAEPGISFCGSEGGAACPLRFSVLGTAMPFCVDGRDSGDPMTEEVCDAGGEGRVLSDARESRGALTVAMMSGRHNVWVLRCCSVQGSDWIEIAA